MRSVLRNAAIVLLIAFACLVSSGPGSGCGGWVEDARRGDFITGGDATEDLILFNTKYGWRTRSGMQVKVAVWPIWHPDHGGVGWYPHEWSCHAWKAERGKVDWNWDDNGVLRRRPDGKIVDAYNNSSGSYVLRTELASGSAWVNYFCRCYNGLFQPAASPTLTDTTNGSLEDYGSVQMSITGENQKLPRGAVVEIWRMSVTAHAAVVEGQPDEPGSAYIRAEGSISGSGGWVLKSNYYD